MKVEIVTPDSTIYTGEQVSLVRLPGIDGSFEIMNDHAPMISVLKKGTIKISVKGEKDQLFEVNGGVIEVLSNRVLILAE